MSYTLAYKGAEIDDILGRAAPGGAIDQALAAKQDALTFDAVPTEGSTNPAESGGIYDAIQAGGAAALAAFATDSVSGDIVSFPDGADNIPVKSFVGSIIPAQSGSGDPAPDNIRPISGWTGANIYRMGINLFDTANATYVDGKILNDSGSEVANVGWGYVGAEIPVIGGATYTISGTLVNSTYGGRIYQYDANKNFLSRVDGFTSTPKTFTVLPNCAYIGFQYGTNIIVKGSVQVQIGSTATAYEAYQGETILLSFGQTVYAGTLTALGGGLWKIQPTHKIDALDSHTWNYGGNNRFNATGFSDMKQDGLRSEYIYCSCYAPNVGGGAYDPFTIYNGTGGYLYVVDDRTTDGATLKTLLAGQKMVYPLATLPDPIIVSASDLQTLLGANAVWLDCGSVTGMTYRADTALYIQKLIGGGGTLSTLSMASPSPSLSLGRVGVLAEAEVSEPEQTEEEAEQLEQTEEE